MIDPPLLSNGTSGSHSIFLSLSFPTNELWWWLKENKAHKPSSKVLAHSSCSMNAICNPFPSLFRESLTRLSRAKPGPVACRPGAEPKGLLECQTAPAAAASLSVTGSDAILLKVMANGFHHLPGKVPYNPEASEGPQSLLLGSIPPIPCPLTCYILPTHWTPAPPLVSQVSTSFKIRLITTSSKPPWPHSPEARPSCCCHLSTNKDALLGHLSHFIVVTNLFPDETHAETLYHQHAGKHLKHTIHPINKWYFDQDK